VLSGSEAVLAEHSVHAETERLDLTIAGSVDDPGVFRREAKLRRT